MFRYKSVISVLLIVVLVLAGCGMWSQEEPEPRLAMFVGVDVSGSFMNGEHFDDAINFLAHYIYGHLGGLGGLEVPDVMFVGTIGGAKPNEPKTFYPIQSFQDKSIEEITAELQTLFPKENPNPFTDYNAFFEQIAATIRNKNLLLRPVSIVMISDGIADAPDIKKNGETNFDKISVRPLEKLSRSVTLRLLYTDAVVGKDWQTKVPRKRVKIWTQDAEVLATWKNPKILNPGEPLETQDKFFEWVKDNVDFGVRSRRVG